MKLYNCYTCQHLEKKEGRQYDRYVCPCNGFIDASERKGKIPEICWQECNKYIEDKEKIKEIEEVKLLYLLENKGW
jgi:hypothetical protein